MYARLHYLVPRPSCPTRRRVWEWECDCIVLGMSVVHRKIIVRLLVSTWHGTCACSTWVGEPLICSMHTWLTAGIQVSHGVSYHGLALNCSTDLSWFDHIVPCGLEGKGVTSLSAVCQRRIETAQVEDVLIKSLAKSIGFRTEHRQNSHTWLYMFIRIRVIVKWLGYIYVHKRSMPNQSSVSWIEFSTEFSSLYTV